MAAKKEEYVDFYLMREPGNTDRGITVSINEYRVFVPYNRKVKIRKCVAEILERSAAQAEIVAHKTDELEQRAQQAAAYL